MSNSGSQYDVKVVLSTVGQGELSSGLKGVSGAAQAMATQLGQADDATRKMSVTFRATDEAGNKLSATVRQLADSHAKYTPLVDQLSGAMVKLAGAYLGLSVVKDIVGDMFSATKAHEDMVTTMAATMTATNGWSNSIEIVTGQLAKLKETAALVNGTETQMTDTFNLLKRTFGGTSDQAVDLTGKLALLARQYNTTVDTLATRLAMAGNTGNLMPRGVAGIALMSTGIDAKQLQVMKDANQAMEYLNATIADNPGLVERLMNGWSYLTAEFKKNKEEALETIGKGLDPLKQALRGLNDSLSGQEAQNAFDTMGANLRILNEQLISLVPSAQTNVSAFTSFSTNLLKGFNVFLADIILIGKELLLGVGFVWDVLLNPDKYFLGDGKARLQKQLDGVVKLYEDNQAKSVKINFGLSANILDTDAKATPGLEKKTPPPPGRLTDLSKLAEEQFKAANAVADAWDKAYLETLTGLDKQVAAVDLATQKEIDDFLKPGVTWAQMVDFTVAKTAEGEAKKTALIAAEEEKRQKKLAVDAAWYTGEMSKLTDQLDAISDDYYVKQAAALQKKTDAELKAINERKAHGDLDPAQYANAIAGLATLDAAEQAHLARERDSIIGFRKTMEDAAAVLVMTTNSVAGGMQAGWNLVAAEMKSTTESVRDYVVGAWQDMSTGFTDTFVALISGNLNSLKDVFKSFIGSLQKTFATFVTDTIMPKIKEALGVANGVGNTGVPLPMGTSYSQVGGGAPTTTAGQPKSNAALWTGAGLMALGAISAASASNTLMGSGLAQTGIQIGMAITAAFPPLFWVGIIVAAVGVIASALTPSPADLHAMYSGGSMTTALKGGKAYGTAGSDTNKATTAALDLANSTTDFFATMFKGADPAIRSSILADLNKKILAYFASLGDFGAHAGGAADFQGDITKLFTEILPKEIMHAMFGQSTNTLADPGGITGTGLAPGGKWGSSNSFSGVDASSPLVQYLTDLGFTIGKVNEIAGQIDVMASADFQKYFSGIVGAVIDFKNNIKNLSQSWSEIQAAIGAAENPDVVAQFATAGLNIVQMSKDLSLYSGQAQVDKAKELNTAADSYYQAAFAALKALQDMMTAIAGQAQTFQQAATSYMKGADWLQADRTHWMQPGGVYDQALASTSDPNSINRIWNEFVTDATASLNYLIGIINQANAGMKTASDLAGKFGSIMADAEAVTTVFTLWGDVVGLQGQYAAAMKLSGQAQIDALNDINASAATLYSSLLQIIQGINSAEASTHKSIQQQIFDNNYAQAGSYQTTTDAQGKTSTVFVPDTKAQRDMLNGQINGLMGGIGGQMTSGDVSSSASEIQGYISRYLGMFQANDPNRAQAVAEANAALQALDTASHARLEELKAQAKIDADAAKAILDETAGAFHDASTGATTALNALSGAVDIFKGKVDTKLTGFAEEIVTELGKVPTAFLAALGLFTTALTGSGEAVPGGGTPGDPKQPLVPALDNSNVALGNFTAALEKATIALGGKAA